MKKYTVNNTTTTANKYWNINANRKTRCTCNGFLLKMSCAMIIWHKHRSLHGFLDQQQPVQLFYMTSDWAKSGGGTNTTWVAKQQASKQCCQWWSFNRAVGLWCNSMYGRNCVHVYAVRHYSPHCPCLGMIYLHYTWL